MVCLHTHKVTPQSSTSSNHNTDIFARAADWDKHQHQQAQELQVWAYSCGCTGWALPCIAGCREASFFRQHPQFSVMLQ